MKDTPVQSLSFDEFDELKNPRPLVQEFDRVVARAMSRHGFLGVLAMGSAAAAMGSLPGMARASATTSRFAFTPT